MKLTVNEKQAIEKICAISNKDKRTVREVLLALLKMSTLEMYMAINEDKTKITIPYICDLDVSYSDAVSKKGGYVKINLEAIPNEGLSEEITAIANGDLTPTKDFIKKSIYKSFGDMLEIEND